MGTEQAYPHSHFITVTYRLSYIQNAVVCTVAHHVRVTRIADTITSTYSYGISVWPSAETRTVRRSRHLDGARSRHISPRHRRAVLGRVERKFQYWDSGKSGKPGGGEFYCKQTLGLPQYLTWPECILRTPLGHPRCWRQVLVAPKISGSQVLGGSPRPENFSQKN